MSKEKKIKATAYAPAHITGFFKIYPNGSTGAGINLEEGVTTTVFAKPAKKQKTASYINGKKLRANTSKAVIKKFLALKSQKFEIRAFHKTRLPIGFGLGASGAGALSLALALNKAIGTKLGFKAAQKIAADAEIENGTGLGDVYAQEFRGLIRGLAPFPSKKAANIPTKATHCVCAFFAPIKTSKIIHSKNWKQKVNKTGTYCMKEISKKPTAENFTKLSRIFSIESTLATKKVHQTMKAIPNASQAMLGSTAFVLTNKPKGTAKKLKKFSKRILISRIAKHGARVL